MLIDMHIHEATYSPDSHMSLCDIVETAKKRGLDGICITDHDSMGIKEQAQQYSKETGFPIFVGVEYYSLQGDITAWGISDFPKERIPAQDFIDHVNRSGGFCVACHPFRNNNRGLEEHLLDVEGLNGIEVLNGSTSFAANHEAWQYCQHLGLVPIGASDAHVLKQVGKYATWFPEKVTTIDQLVAVLKSGLTRPAILQPDGYYILKSSKNYQPHLVK